MPRPLVTRFVRCVVAIALGGCVALTACAPSTAVELTGNVEDDVVVVQAPSIPVPSPDLEAGFGGGSGSAGGGYGSRSTTPTAAGITGLGAFARVAEVRVRPGAPTTVGQVLAVLDSALLDANVRAAAASRRTAEAQVPVVTAALDKLATTRADLASTRSTLISTTAQLRATRSQLAAQLAALQATLKRIQSLPPGGIPSGVPPTSTPGGGQPGGLPPGGLPSPATLQAGIAQLQAAIAQIDTGLAKAGSGLRQLSAASTKVSDARTQLRHVRTLARIAASASAVGVELAKYQRSLAEVRAPVGGVVISVVSVGDVVAPGATIAEIRQLGRAKVSAWLAPSELPRVSVGDTAYVTSDSLSQPVRGEITRIAGRADYPPTSSATKEVHLTRAVPVEITVNADQATLPPGTPVDISIVSSSRQ